MLDMGDRTILMGERHLAVFAPGGDSAPAQPQHGVLAVQGQVIAVWQVDRVRYFDVTQPPAAVAVLRRLLRTGGECVNRALRRHGDGHGALAGNLRREPGPLLHGLRERRRRSGRSTQQGRQRQRRGE
jgi:hypothetical protein